MVTVTPITIENHQFIATEVILPKTHLIAIHCNSGYIMCGALDVHLLNTRLKDRHIIAARAVGVKSVKELLEAPLESVTDEAISIGVTTGMKGSDALLLMAAYCEQQAADKK